MEVNPIIYPSVHTVGYIEYSNSILELEASGSLPYDTPWDSSNCYTGYKGLDGLVCSHPSSGTISNRFNFAAEGEPYVVNLRPMWKDRLDGTQPIPTLTQKWTGEETLPSFNSIYGCGTWYPVTKFNVNDLCFLVTVQLLEKSSGRTISMYYDDLLNNYPKKLVENGYNDNYIITGMELTPYYYSETRDYRSRCNIFFVGEVITSTGIFYTIPIGESIGNIGSFYADYINYNFRDNSFTYTPGVVENRVYSGELILTKVSDDSNLYYTQVSNNSNIDFSAIAIGDYVVQDNIWARRVTETNINVGSCWNKEKIEKSVSALGCYWSGTRDSAIISPLGKDCTDPLIRLGVIDPADGMTDGSYVTGTAVADEPQSDWDDFSENEYTPIDPESSIEESDKITGDSIEGNWIGAQSGDGFVTQYCLTAEQFEELGKRLWTKVQYDKLFWESISSTTTDSTSINVSLLLDYVTALRVYPFKLSDMPSYKSLSQPWLFFGTGKSGVDVGGNLGKLTDTCDTISGGSYYVSPLYNNFLDYNPYTTVSVYIPYCGNVELNTKEVMGRTLSIRYHIDYNTGAMAAIIHVSEGDKTYPVAIKSGTIGATIQLTSANSSQLASNIINAGMNQLSTGTNIIGSAISGAVGGATKGGVAGAVIGGVGGALPSIIQGLESAAESSLNAKLIPPATFGQTSGFSSLGAPQRAYVTIRRPTVYNPSNYGHTVGNIYNAAKDINELKGFTICNNVDTSGIIATEKERNQIKQILESGFYA